MLEGTRSFTGWFFQSSTSVCRSVVRLRTSILAYASPGQGLDVRVPRLPRMSPHMTVATGLSEAELHTQPAWVLPLGLLIPFPDLETDLGSSPARWTRGGHTSYLTVLAGHRRLYRNTASLCGIVYWSSRVFACPACSALLLVDLWIGDLSLRRKEKKRKGNKRKKRKKNESFCVLFLVFRTDGFDLLCGNVGKQFHDSNIPWVPDLSVQWAGPIYVFLISQNSPLQQWNLSVYFKQKRHCVCRIASSMLSFGGRAPPPLNTQHTASLLWPKTECWTSLVLQPRCLHYQQHVPPAGNPPPSSPASKPGASAFANQTRWKSPKRIPKVGWALIQFSSQCAWGVLWWWWWWRRRWSYFSSSRSFWSLIRLGNTVQGGPRGSLQQWK